VPTSQSLFGLNPLLGLNSGLFGSPLSPYGASGLGSYASPYGYGYGSSANPYAAAYGGGYGSNTAAPYGNAYGSSGSNAYGSSGNNQSTPETNAAQAALLREQVRSAKVDNARKAFDEAQYERDKTPSAEDERQKAEQEQLNRSLNNPPATEVQSGQALNTILADLRKLAAGNDSGLPASPRLPLDEEGLRYINVTQGAGSIGLIKHEGHLNWPSALAGADSAEHRHQLDSLAGQAVKQATAFSKVDAGILDQMRDELGGLRGQLAREVGGLSSTQYLEAQRYLKSFDDVLTALRQNDVGSYFTGKYSLQDGTVLGLVRQMGEQGLRFAPAVPGDEAAYTALHEALAAYDRAARGQTAQR